jgi:hypothetical protein
VLHLTVGPALAVVDRHREGRSGRVFLWLLWGAALFSFVRYVESGISMRAAAGLATLLGYLASVELVRRFARDSTVWPTARWALAALGGIGFLLIAGTLQRGMRSEFAQLGFARAPIEPYWLEASRLIDDPERPLRIAFTSGPWIMGDNWFVYPFLGTRLQNEALYVPVSKDGASLPFGSQEVNERFERSADFAAWLGRLRESEVNAVMSFSPPSIELGWMEQRPDVFRRLLGAPGDWGMFVVGDASRTRNAPGG